MVSRRSGLSFQLSACESGKLEGVLKLTLWESYQVLCEEILLMGARTCSGQVRYPEQECNTRNGNVIQRQILPRVGKI